MKKYENLKLDSQLCFALYSATHAITRSYREALDKVGLTYPQYLVILALREEKKLAVGKLAKKLNLDSASLTPLLKRIEIGGLIIRQRNKIDERIVEIELTEKARNLIPQLSQVQQEIHCQTKLHQSEYELLKHSLSLLTDTLSQKNEHELDV